MLAGQQGMSVEQAKTLLAAAPVAGTDSTGDQIVALPEAKGREQLARTLAEQPGMTVEQENVTGSGTGCRCGKYRRADYGTSGSKRA
ncbi:hypothetical protein ACLBOM_21320 [Escherichia coli]